MDFDINSAVDANKAAVQTTSFDLNTAQDANPPPPQKQPSGVDSFLRGIMKFSPGEEMQTASAKFDFYAGRLYPHEHMRLLAHATITLLIKTPLPHTRTSISCGVI